MRIALLSYEYPTETGFGGIGTYTWHHARALARLGHEVHVLAGATSLSMLREESHDGVTVWRTRGAGSAEWLFGKMEPLRWWWTRERARNAINMWNAVRRLERRMRFNVIEAPECGAEAMLVSRTSRSPLVVRFHSPAALIMPYYDVLDGDRRACTWLERNAIDRARALTSCSRFLAGVARDVMRVSRPIEVIHNGIDTEWFDAADGVDVHEKHGISRDRPLILFAGRVEPRKGSSALLATMREVLERHDVSFAIAGGDPFNYVRDVLMPALTSRPLRGTPYYLGRLDVHEVRSCMRQSDIVFLPSLWESCPYSCLEAMTARRAIVASDAGGLPELLDDGVSGRVVRTDDVEGYVRALGELLGDPGARGRMGTAARATVEKSHRSDDVARRTVDVYARVAG